MEHEEEEEDTFYSPERFIIEEKDEAFNGDQETIKLCLMRASVEKKDPSCKVRIHVNDRSSSSFFISFLRLSL